MEQRTWLFKVQILFVFGKYEPNIYFSLNIDNEIVRAAVLLVDLFAAEYLEN